MTAIFMSDVHLRDADSVKTKLVIRFLQEVASRFERLYILGDLFDIWPGTNTFLLSKFAPVIEALEGLVKKGCEVHYVEGNHDFKLGEFFPENLGIKVYPNVLTDTWNGQKIYMAHGDLGNPKEVGYRVLRKLLRSSFLHRAMKAFPEDFVFRVGLGSSQLSRDYQRSKGRKNKDAQVRQIYRQTAESIFAEGYDVVIMGHTHLPDDVVTRVGRRTCRYINIGDWVSNFTYLEFDGTGFYTKTHPVKAL